MIKSIRMLSKEEVEKTKTDEWHDCGLGGYEFDLPALNGKTIEFKPGMNVIVGRNGCGKTSLLNVIRKLTMCDGTFSSHYSRGHGEARMHRMRRRRISAFVSGRVRSAGRTTTGTSMPRRTFFWKGHLPVGEEQ